ncbi:hypothetical protein C8R43DRAFT_442373 [Mycena crocata]|nr:hypothetical protein C8R43DRAFT_442373 [Mycena crocata]
MLWVLSTLYTLEVAAVPICVVGATLDSQAFKVSLNPHISPAGSTPCLAISSRNTPPEHGLLGYVLNVHRLHSLVCLPPLRYAFLPLWPNQLAVIMLVITLAKLAPRWNWNSGANEDGTARQWGRSVLGRLGSGGSVTCVLRSVYLNSSPSFARSPLCTIPSAFIDIYYPKLFRVFLSSHRLTACLQRRHPRARLAGLLRVHFLFHPQERYHLCIELLFTLPCHSAWANHCDLLHRRVPHGGQHTVNSHLTPHAKDDYGRSLRRRSELRGALRRFGLRPAQGMLRWLCSLASHRFHSVLRRCLLSRPCIFLPTKTPPRECAHQQGCDAHQHRRGGFREGIGIELRKGSLG